MSSLTALMLTPLLIWAGVFFFVWTLDRRVRALERRLEQRPRLREDELDRETIAR